MDVVRKDATITNTDDAFPGSFEVILSAPTRDRDGETLSTDTWKTPLPEHIAFDIDHGMSVATTVGSGTPRIDAKTGHLIVSGTYSSLPRAQEVRTLVNEKHIRNTSVTFLRERTQKDGRLIETRELLNGTFTPVPSNRESVVLSAKSAAEIIAKSGRRNSTSDQAHLDAAVEHLIALGATYSGGDTDGDGDVAAAKSFTTPTLKSTLEDVFRQHQAGDITADEALTLIQEATAPSGESTDVVRETDETADSGATEEPAAAATAAAAGTDEAPVEDDSIKKQVNRLRLYATLTERN